MGAKFTKRIEELIRNCMMVVSQIRLAQNHNRLAFHFNCILGVEKNAKDWHKRIIELIGPEKLEILKIIFPNGMRRQGMGCDSRWNTQKENCA